MRRSGDSASTGERSGYKILLGKHEQMRSLRIARHRWQDNMRMRSYRNRTGMLTEFNWFRTGTGGGLLCL
jgi:hypothetical protein